MAPILIAFSSSNDYYTHIQISLGQHHHQQQQLAQRWSSKAGARFLPPANILSNVHGRPLAPQFILLPTILRADSLFFPSTEVLDSTFTGSALRSARIVCHPSLQPSKRGMHGCSAVVLLHQQIQFGGLSAFSLNPQGL
jgi:hypothetical protein